MFETHEHEIVNFPTPKHAMFKNLVHISYTAQLDKHDIRMGKFVDECHL